VPASRAKSIVVVGGGIAGLAAAHRLTGAGAAVTLLERDGRLGGKILTERRDGFVVEAGPDAFLASKPHGRALCEELGLELIGSNQNARRAFVMRSGRLHPLPEGFAGVAPRRLGPMLTTRLLSPAGKARMAMEWFIPPIKDDRDESLAELVSRRVGREAWTRLVEPLVTGVSAGDGERLSAAATFPMIPAAERAHGGFIRAGRAAKRAGQSTPTALLFATPRNGLGAMVDALNAAIGDDAIRTGASVREIAASRGGYEVLLDDGDRLEAGAVIVATPAYTAADMLERLSPELAAELRQITYVSTATVSLAYPDGAVGRPLDGHGFVLPRVEGSQIVACTITSTKFPHRAPGGWTLVRAFIGRAGRPDALAMDDAELEGLARAELSRSLGIDTPPAWSRVFRWPQAIPQYNVGHLARVDRIAGLAASLPGIELAGHPYRGIGIPDCIASGQAAAAAALEAVDSGAGRSSLG
jgi:oxygen-dependent protoporphyrinogen oxidase